MFKKGNTEASKHHAGGRKTKEEEFRDCIEKMKKITIEELATEKVYKQLGQLKGRDKKDRQGVKDIALPVYLKSKADKTDITSGGKPINLSFDKSFKK